MPPHIRYDYIWYRSGCLCVNVWREFFHFSQCTCFHYLCNPFMQDWSLELEEVFSLEREGESDKFAPYRDKLGNRMLLWHGRLWICDACYTSYLYVFRCEIFSYDTMKELENIKKGMYTNSCI